MLKALYL